MDTFHALAKRRKLIIMPPLQRPLAEDVPLCERHETSGFLSIGIQKAGFSDQQLSVFESLPSIQEWLETHASNKAMTPFDAVLAVMTMNNLWLEAVTQELRFIVPVGAMSRSLWELSSAVIQSLARQRKSNYGTLAFDLMRRMLHEEDCNKFQLTSTTYTLVMRAVPTSAEQLFRTLVLRHKENPLRCMPSVSNRVALIVAMTKIGRRSQALRFLWAEAPVSLFNVLISACDSPVDADKLLMKMEDHLRQGKGTCPNLRSFHIVLRKWVGVDAGRAEDVMERVLICGTSSPKLQPSAAFFVDLMKAHIDNPERVDRVVKRLVEHLLSIPVNMRSWPGYQLSTGVFETCMTAWFKKDQPERLEQVLADMKENSVKPSKLCWSLVVKCWSTVGNLEQAENVVRNAGEAADVDLCNIVLQAWSQRNVIQAQAYFDRMCKQPFRKQPNGRSYQIMLTAWKRSSSACAKNQIKTLLRRMEQHAKEGIVQPTDEIVDLANVPEMNQVDTLVTMRTGKVPRKGKRFNPSHGSTPPYSKNRLAKDIFERMEQAKVKPTTASFACIMTAWAQNNECETPSKIHARLDPKQVPDVDSCNSVLAVCLAGTSIRAPAISRSMIMHMMREYRSGNEEMLPKPLAFTRLFSRLYTERSAIQASVSIAITEDLKFPDNRFALACFTYALTVCSLTRDIDAPKYAERLWRSFTTKSLECFNLLLKTFANHPKHVLSQKAEWFLYANQNRSDWKPSAESVELVIEAVAKSRRPNAAQQAFVLLQRFQLQITNPGCLSHVLFACARASFGTNTDRLYYFNLASRAVSNWKERHGLIISLHYDRLLTCAIRFAPTSEKRIAMAKGVFDECLAAGLVDKFILRRFWTLAPAKMRRELLGRYTPRDVSLSDIPSAWTCSVSPRKLPRKH